MPTDRIEAWLRLRDVARFNRDADSAGRHVSGIGRAAHSTDAQMGLMNRTSARSHTIIRGVGTAALYTVGGLGLLAGAGVAAGVALGVKFNANMEQLEVAFKNFLGSTGAARSYLEDLYKIAAKTPFEFPDLAAAARKFLAFGFAANDTKKILMTVGDTIAGIGGGAEEIQRVVLAFGQIKAKGRVQSEELLQFAELGIPAYQILRKELGLTSKELQNKLRRGAISADDGIAALQRGMDKAFGGSSRKQAQTFIGQLSTMKDNANLLLGVLSKPAFDWLRGKVLPKANKALNTVTQWARGGGLQRGKSALEAGFKGGRQSPLQSFQGADKIFFKLGAAAAKVVPIIQKGWAVIKGAGKDLIEAFKPAEPYFKNVMIPFLKGLAVGVLANLAIAWKILIFVIKVFATELGFLGKIMAPFKGVFTAIGVAVGWVFGGPILKAIGTVSRFARVLSIPIRIVDRLIGVFAGAALAAWKFRGAFRILGRVAGWLGGRFGSVWKIVRAGVDLFGKFSWIIGPFLLRKLSAVINPLNVVRGVFHSFGIVMRFVLRIITAIVKAIAALIDKLDAVKKPLGAVGGFLGGVSKHLPDVPGIPHFAGGGFLGAGQVGVVGDAGPEIAVGAGGGARIIPLQRGGISPGLAGVIHLRTEVPVVVEGREVARATADQTADWNARKGRPS